MKFRSWTFFLSWVSSTHDILLSLSLLSLLIEFLISPSLSLRIFSLSRRIFLRLFVFYIKFVFSSHNISPSPRSARYCLWMWNLILILSSSSFFFIFTFLSYAFFVSPSRHFCLFLLSEWYFSYWNYIGKKSIRSIIFFSSSFASSISILWVISIESIHMEILRFASSIYILWVISIESIAIHMEIVRFVRVIVF